MNFRSAYHSGSFAPVEIAWRVRAPRDQMSAPPRKYSKVAAISRVQIRVLRSRRSKWREAVNSAFEFLRRLYEYVNFRKNSVFHSVNNWET